MTFHQHTLHIYSAFPSKYYTTYGSSYTTWTQFQNSDLNLLLQFDERILKLFKSTLQLNRLKSYEGFEFYQNWQIGKFFSYIFLQIKIEH